MLWEWKVEQRLARLEMMFRVFLKLTERQRLLIYIDRVNGAAELSIPRYVRYDIRASPRWSRAREV